MYKFNTNSNNIATLDVMGFIPTSNSGYLRTTSEGFRTRDGVVLPEVVGTIADVKNGAVKWVNGQPTRIHLEPSDPVPDGYKSSIEITIQTNMEEWKLSLENLASQRNFGDFTKALLSQNLNYSDVTVRLSTESRRTKNGSSFNAVRFEIVSSSPACPTVDQAGDDEMNLSDLF